MLACRFCKISLVAKQGCSVCNDWRSNFVSSDESADIAPSLAEVGAESIAALRQQVRYIHKTLKDLPGDEGLNKNLVLMTNSVAKILEAARKLQDDGIAAVRNMSFEERARLFIQWYASLPPAMRTRVSELVQKFELDIAKPLELL